MKPLLYVSSAEKPWFGIRIIYLFNNRKPFKVRIAYLSEEIAKLNVALNRSRSII